VSTALQSSAESLKAFAVAKAAFKKVCAPIYSDLRIETQIQLAEVKGLLQKATEDMVQAAKTEQERVADVVNADEEAIGKRWADDKLFLVPGAELLGSVFANFGLKFKKDRDGPQIAALMRRDEIDVDIKTALTKISS
jgi:hypothetical protein